MRLARACMAVQKGGAKGENAPRGQKEGSEEW